MITATQIQSQALQPHPAALHLAVQPTTGASYWVDVNRLLARLKDRAEPVRQQILRQLDELLPLKSGSHSEVCEYLVYYHQLLALFPDGSSSGLQQSGQLVGLTGSREKPTSLLLKAGDLHIELELDSNDCNAGRQALQNLQIEARVDEGECQPYTALPAIDTLLDSTLTLADALSPRLHRRCSERSFRTPGGDDYLTQNRQLV